MSMYNADLVASVLFWNIAMVSRMCVSQSESVVYYSLLSPKGSIYSKHNHILGSRNPE